MVTPALPLRFATGTIVSRWEREFGSALAYGVGVSVALGSGVGSGVLTTPTDSSQG
jgi:hypothetical protein